MSRKAVEQLMDRWVNDSAFRAEVRRDTEAAVRRTGLELDQDEGPRSATSTGIFRTRSSRRARTRPPFAS